MAFKIKTISAYIATEKDGTEGIIGMHVKGSWVPFVCADQIRIEDLKPYAKKIGEAENVPIKLVRFHTREDIEDIWPQKT